MAVVCYVCYLNHVGFLADARQAFSWQRQSYFGLVGGGPTSYLVTYGAFCIGNEGLTLLLLVPEAMCCAHCPSPA